METTAPQPVKAGWTYSPHGRVESVIRDMRDKFPATYPSNLGHVRQLLERLGSPHRHLPFTFHVAGTNGKGSTIAFLRAILEAGGQRPHIYTSPHLVRFEERIVLGGKPIGEKVFLSLVHECEMAARKTPVSFFEFFTVVAFLGFSYVPADAVLLETGMGGLHDATNVIGGPNLVSILTRISCDHTHILGETLSEIAQQKAGIIKQGCPVIAAHQPSAEVMDIFIESAGSALRACGQDWRVEARADGFGYISSQHTFNLPLPVLIGAHQVENAGAAIAAIENSPFAHLLTVEVLAKAMSHVRWPGRMQHVTQGALYALLPSGWELWIDGAHNDSGADAVAAQIRNWGDDKPLHMLSAIKKSKDIGAFYQKLLPHAKSMQVIDVSHIEAPMAATSEVESVIRQTGYAAISSTPSLEKGIRTLVLHHPGPQRILITGSLYLAGEALKA